MFTILLVEDEPADADLVRVALSDGRLKVSLHHVSDGVEAIHYLRREGAAFADAPRPDLILLDLNMPRMNGREFLTAIKQDNELASIPVVVLTTSDARADLTKCYQSGASGYVVKPLDIDAFIHAIKGIEDYWLTIVTLPAD